MPPSTSLASAPSPDRADPWSLASLEGFYRIHAHVYDLTRPFLLFGRAQAVQRLALAPDARVLDVGCGTGWSLPLLHETGARVIGIECSEPMRRQALRRLQRHLLERSVVLDPRPYGTHARYARSVDGILFSYSLSMIPPFEVTIARAREDLRQGGRIAVLDFLDAREPVHCALRSSHVYLGPERLEALAQTFPHHQVEIRSVGLWRYFLFVGEADEPTEH